MANITQNDTYQNTPAPKLSPGFRYTPSTTYQNLAQIRYGGTSPLAPAAPALPGTPEYLQAKQAGISQYGNLVNNGMGIPTQTSFLPPLGDPRTPIPIPSDYGTFMDPMTINNVAGEKLSWGTPTAPVIRNLPGDVPGQYVQDTSNPQLLVKTNRGSNPVADNAIRDGRPGFMYQIDHIMPLELGGADTLANRQLLTADQNDQKTRAQAIPYTLYAHGDISLSEARTMAMQWKNRDLTDVPQPNGVGLVSDTKGKTGIEIAREVAQRWSQPAKPKFKDVMAGIPEAAKDFGKGWLPDSVREFVKGFGSGATLGFLPYEQGADESGLDWLTGKVGQVAGAVGSFFLGGALVDGALLLGGMARGSIAAYRGVATAEALKTGFQAAEVGADIATGARAAQTTFKSLNKTPGYLSKLLTPETIKRAGKFGVVSAVVGQGSQFVANKFNPYILSGQEPVKDQGMTGAIGNIFKDLSLGALYGVGSPTIKGTAYATMLPLTLTYLANPDDPLDAITNGVIFGAMHAAGTAKSPGYFNVEAFGGKPYESPVTKSFEDTVNKAAHASLSYYAPDVLSGYKPTERIPEPVVQQAKDTAIENVWRRFFFGKETPSTAQQKTLADFQGFSKDLETGLGTPGASPLSGLSRLSYAARRATTAATKAKNVDIAKTYGKDYQTQNEFKGDAEALLGDGMDLQTALTEIKRITVAARQLYKGNLTGELRNKADVDDLLSFSKNNLQGRFDSMERFSNPPIAKQAVDSIDESFMKRSFNNDNPTPSGKYPNGDIALTGAALNINKAGATYFFQQRGTGNASPNILLVDRSDTGPLWSMRNQLLDPTDVKTKSYAPDPNPENALQAFGVVKNPKTGQKELVPLGWVASDFRLNQATNKDHRAYNQHPLVLKYKETGGKEGMPPLSLHKDQIAPKMRDEGISVLVANLDGRATISTIESGNPFIPVNIRDANWIYSKNLGDRLSQQENKNPISMAIARVSNAVGSKQKSAAIKEMNKNIVRPAVDYIPTSVTPVNPKTDRMTQPREETRGVLQEVTQSLDVASPAQVKEAFKKNFGILLEDGQAVEVFNRRNEITFRDAVKLMVDAVNNGKTDAATKIKVQFMKTYLESGALQASEAGKAVPDMLLLGKMKNASTRGQEEHLAAPTSVTPTTKPLDLQNYSEKKVEPAPVSSITNTQMPVTRPTDIPASVTPSEPSGGLIDQIITNAQRELPALKKSAPATAEIGESETALATGYLAEMKDAIDNAQPPGRRYAAGDEAMVTSATRKYANTHESVISDIENRIQSDLQGRNLPQSVIDEVKRQVRSEGQNYSASILDTNAPVAPNPGIPKPKFVASDFYKNIDEGIANTKEPAANYFAKAFDTGLKSVAGPGYKKNPALPKILADYFSGEFFSESNKAGKEIQQTEEIMKARAAGDFAAEKAAYNKRTKQLTDNPTGSGGNLSDAEIQRLGLESGGEGTKEFAGMTVRPWYQEEGLVGNLTRGEDLMSALFADVPVSAAASVRAVRKLFLGYGKTGEGGLRKFILDRLSPGKSPSIPFGGLETQAVAADASHALKTKNERTKLTEAENLLPLLKKQSESIQKAIENPEDRSNWQTPALLEENLKDILTKIAKYSKVMEETGDGSGGPGMPKASTDRYGGSVGYSGLVKAIKGPTRAGDNRLDGKGGPGDMWGSISNAVGGLWNKATGKTVYNAPMDTPPAIVAPLPPSPTQVSHIPKFPSQYSASMAEASKHTGIPQETMVRHFNMENSGKWDPNLVGYDPSDFGITQLNPRGVATITGTAYKGAQNYFKDNYGHDFNPKDGNDQILGASVLLNHIKQFGLPAAGIKNPTLKDQLISYNMGPTAYVASLAKNAPQKLVDKRIRYENLLKSHGVSLDSIATTR